MGTGIVSDVNFNLRYPGQYADQESGLHYNYFRSFDPRTGRYNQFDPIGLAGGWNGFAYAGGSPLNYTDPTGLVVPAPIVACLANPICAAAMGAAAAATAKACVDTYNGVKNLLVNQNRTPAPFLPGDPYSPESVDGRRSELRDQLGTGNLDPDSPIPDQGPGRDLGDHRARGRTPHDTGERNVNSHEEHSRRPKNNPTGRPRR